MNETQKRAIEFVLLEREQQDAKWGEQNHDMLMWLAILHEETGELAQAVVDKKFSGPQRNNVFLEAVQSAAVALGIVEYLIRTEKK